VAVAGVIGAVNWAWLVAEVLDGRRTLIVDFETTSAPLYRAFRAVLPDYRSAGMADWALQAVWLAALAVVTVLAVRPARRRRPPSELPP
jgi:membrane protein implicated in regulation of membrane protease activity